MILRLAQNSTCGKSMSFGFTLIELLISLVAFGLMTGGLIYGYVQINRMAVWTCMSLAAQSYASEGLEVARSAQWTYVSGTNTFGPGTGDELGFLMPATPGTASGNGFTNYSRQDTMDIPTTGAPIYVTNFVTISNVYWNNNPPLRQIRSDCVWTMPLTGTLCTNTVITLRAPDQ
jgi:prepilin-type N-terminal cleavage/methylation domain-containing protein